LTGTPVSGLVQSKYFAEVLGGRQNLIFQARCHAGRAAEVFTVSFVLQPLQSFSTLRTAQYNSLALYLLAKLQYSF
jgi:hypothetical protein